MPDIKKFLKLPLILTFIYIIKYMLLYFIQRKSNFQYFLFYTAKRRLKRKKKQ